MRLDVRIDEVAEVTDDDPIRLHADVLENIELFERRLSGDPGVRENRQVRCQVRLADRAEHLPFIGGDVVPRSDLAKHTRRVIVDLLDERLHDLLLAHRRDFFRVVGLRVETRADDEQVDRTLHRGSGAGN